MTTLEQIKTEVKTLGYNTKQIIVREKKGYADWIFEIGFKFQPTKEEFNKVEEIAKKHENIDICQRTNEVLHGGNTYVTVGQWDAEIKAVLNLKEFAA